jgi:hypothetical protein
MTHENAASPAPRRAAPRRAWTAPQMRRLATSSAALGVGDTGDAEGMS